MSKLVLLGVYHVFSTYWGIIYLIELAVISQLISKSGQFVPEE